MNIWRRQHGGWRAWVAAGMAVASMGCVVYQPPGQGRVLHLTEPRTGGGYYLYLPDGYDEAAAAGRHLPLVMTFHGMRPFDNAHSQICEWQQEADRYGYVVCAPQLATSDLTSPLPLDRVTGALRRDEQRVVAIMDELGHTTSIDPNAVLATAWSYGGYIAHYMVNRHPQRFSCLSVKQSNFCEDILDAQAVAKYRDRKIGVFYTENDLKLCRDESSAAARWYSRHGFDLTFAVFRNLGHERRPGLAAWFFARTCDVAPKTPPVELAKMQVKELPPPESRGAGMAQVFAEAVPRGFAGKPVELAAEAPQLFHDQPDPAGESYAARTRSAAGTRAGEFDDPVVRPIAQGPASLRTRPVPAAPGNLRSTPRRAQAPPSLPHKEHPITVRLSSTIGISPLLVSYSVSLPVDLREGAFYLWTDNGEPISNAPNGQRYLSEPGTHRLEILVTTADGREFAAAQIVTVLERIKKGSSG